MRGDCGKRQSSRWPGSRGRQLLLHAQLPPQSWPGLRRKPWWSSDLLLPRGSVSNSFQLLKLPGVSPDIFPSRQQVTWSPLMEARLSCEGQRQRWPCSHPSLPWPLQQFLPLGPLNRLLREEEMHLRLHLCCL